MHLPSEQAVKEIVRSAAQVGLEVDQAHGVLKEFKAALKKKVRVSERPSNFVVNFTMPDPDAYEADDPPCGRTKNIDFRPTIPLRSTHHHVTHGQQRGNQFDGIMQPQMNQMAHMAQMWVQMARAMGVPGVQQDMPITINPRRRSRAICAPLEDDSQPMEETTPAGTSAPSKVSAIMGAKQATVAPSKSPVEPQSKSPLEVPSKSPLQAPIKSPVDSQSKSPMDDRSKSPLKHGSKPHVEVYNPVDHAMLVQKAIDTRQEAKARAKEEEANEDKTPKPKAKAKGNAKAKSQAKTKAVGKVAEKGANSGGPASSSKTKAVGKGAEKGANSGGPASSSKTKAVDKGAEKGATSGGRASSAKTTSKMKRPAAHIEECHIEGHKVPRPAIMQPGDPTVMYLGGKLQRNGGGFRAFKFANSVASRPETKIDRKYNIGTLGEQEAWSRACAYIEEGIDVE